MKNLLFLLSLLLTVALGNAQNCDLHAYQFSPAKDTWTIKADQFTDDSVRFEYTNPNDAAPRYQTVVLHANSSVSCYDHDHNSTTPKVCEYEIGVAYSPIAPNPNQLFSDVEDGCKMRFATWCDDGTLSKWSKMKNINF